MSQQLSLERMVADWMAEEAAGETPAFVVEHVLTTTRRTRPLPRWLAIVRESPMRSRTRHVVGVPTRRLVLIGALLFLAAAVVIGAIGALLLRQEPTADDWPGFRGDAAHSGPAVRGPAGNPVVEWRFEADAGVRSNISVAGEFVLVPSDDGVLHAVSIADGSEQWRFEAAAPMLGPFVSDGRVYVADGGGIIHALSLADGSSLWTTATPLEGQPGLTILGNRLYAGTGDGSIVAIDASTGLVTWRTSVSTALQAAGTPAASGDVVVVATDDRHLVALDAASGRIRWDVEVGSEPLGTPVLAVGVAYIGGSGSSQTGQLTAYDVATGAERWRVDEPVTSPAVVAGVGYTGGTTGTAAAIDLSTGKVRWRASFQGVVRAPAVAGDTVYLSADGERRIVAVDRTTGGLLWTYYVDGANDCCIAVARGLVFVGTSVGTVYAIGGDGATLAPEPLATGSVSTPTPTPTRTSAPPPPRLDTSVVWTVASGAPDFVPWAMTMAPDGRLWAVEGGSDRFSIFTTDGEFVESWGRSGVGEGEFDLTRANGDPYGMIAFGRDGSFHVLDAGNRRIQHFASDRTFLRAWGSVGNGPSQFNDPVGLAVDPEGNVHVLDDVRRVIETFDADGNLLRSIPAFPAGLGVTTVANGLSIGPNGHFYVTAAGPSQVLELDLDGALIATYGAPGSGAGAITDQPFVTAFDVDGRLYVSQGPTRGDRPGVLVFDIDGTYLGGFGPLGAGEAELGFPWGIVVADDGIYVSDAGGLEGVGYRSLIRRFEPVLTP